MPPSERMSPHIGAFTPLHLPSSDPGVTIREFIRWKMGQKLPISLGQKEKGRLEWDLDKPTIE
jgi:hypothetical protein